MDNWHGSPGAIFFRDPPVSSFLTQRWKGIHPPKKKHFVQKMVQAGNFAYRTHNLYILYSKINIFIHYLSIFTNIKYVWSLRCVNTLSIKAHVYSGTCIMYLQWIRTEQDGLYLFNALFDFCQVPEESMDTSSIVVCGSQNLKMISYSIAIVV